MAESGRSKISPHVGNVGGPMARKDYVQTGPSISSGGAGRTSIPSASESISFPHGDSECIGGTSKEALATVFGDEKASPRGSASSPCHTGRVCLPTVVSNGVSGHG